MPQATVECCSTLLTVFVLSSKEDYWSPVWTTLRLISPLQSCPTLVSTLKWVYSTDAISYLKGTMPSKLRRRQLQKKDYYIQNREKLLLRKRERYADETSSRSRSCNQWNEDTANMSFRERSLLYGRCYYQKHRDFILARQRKRNNKDRILEQSRDEVICEQSKDSAQAGHNGCEEKDMLDEERADSTRKRKRVGKRTLIDDSKISPGPLDKVNCIQSDNV